MADIGACQHKKETASAVSSEPVGYGALGSPARHGWPRTSSVPRMRLREMQEPVVEQVEQSRGPVGPELHDRVLEELDAEAHQRQLTRRGVAEGADAAASREVVPEMVIRDPEAGAWKQRGSAYEYVSGADGRRRRGEAELQTKANRDDGPPELDGGYGRHAGDVLLA